jgi:hypothetical protein
MQSTVVILTRFRIRQQVHRMGINYEDDTITAPSISTPFLPILALATQIPTFHLNACSNNIIITYAQHFVVGSASPPLLTILTFSPIVGAVSTGTPSLNTYKSAKPPTVKTSV